MTKEQLLTNLKLKSNNHEKIFWDAMKKILKENNSTSTPIALWEKVQHESTSFKPISIRELFCSLAKRNDILAPNELGIYPTQHPIELLKLFLHSQKSMPYVRFQIENGKKLICQYCNYAYECDMEQKLILDHNVDTNQILDLTISFTQLQGNKSLNCDNCRKKETNFQEFMFFKSTSDYLLVNLKSKDMNEKSTVSPGVPLLSHYENIYINVETISEGKAKVVELHTFDVLAAISHSNEGEYWATVKKNDYWLTAKDTEITSTNFYQPYKIKFLLLQRKQVDKMKNSKL